MTDPSPESTPRSLLVPTVVATVLLETATCVLRFGLHLQSGRDTAFLLKRLTGGIRIHHGYIGLLLIAAAAWMPPKHRNRTFWLLVLGQALLYSDLIHHFVVLWLVTGSPQFDLLYP